MRKRSFIMFVFLLIFMVVVSGVIDWQHIIVGGVLSLFIVWFWKDLNPRLPGLLSPRELLHFGRCILMLIGYVIQSNIEVAKILLYSHESVAPMFLEMELGVKSNWGRVFLATCITITPGTIAADFNPETGMYTIHALTTEMGISLYYWRIVSEIRKLEELVQRGESSCCGY